MSSAPAVLAPAEPLALDLDRDTRGMIAEQVSTAKKHPRSVQRFLSEAQQLVTLDQDTADACLYALPRDGKTIEGPSARFAEIVASCWGNLRIDARMVADDGKLITARGTAWDLERNVLLSYEVQRRVTRANGARFSDDMVMVTANAAASIALRNAVLKAVPAAFWKPLYLKAKEVALGTADTLSASRTKLLAYFQKQGATPAQVFTLLQIAGEADLTREHIATLRGLATAIRDGDTTVEQAFSSDAPGIFKTPMRLSEREQAALAPPPTPGPPPVADADPFAPVRVLTVTPTPKPGTDLVCWVAKLDGGHEVYTWDAPLGQALEAACGANTPLRLGYTGERHQQRREVATAEPHA